MSGAVRGPVVIVGGGPASLAVGTRIAAQGVQVRVLAARARGARLGPPVVPVERAQDPRMLVHAKGTLNLPIRSARALRALGVGALWGAAPAPDGSLAVALAARCGPGLAAVLGAHAAARFGAPASALDAALWPLLLAGPASGEASTPLGELEVILEAGGDWLDETRVLEVEIEAGRVVAVRCEHGWEACDGGLFLDGPPASGLAWFGESGPTDPVADWVGLRFVCSTWSGPEDVLIADARRLVWRLRRRPGAIDAWACLAGAHPLRGAADTSVLAAVRVALADWGALELGGEITRLVGAAPVPVLGAPQRAAAATARLAARGVRVIGGFERGIPPVGAQWADPDTAATIGASTPPWGPA